MLLPVDGAGGVDGDHLAHDELIEDHSNGGQVLFLGRGAPRMPFDIGGDHDQPHPVEPANTSPLAPPEKTGRALDVGRPRDEVRMLAIKNSNVTGHVNHLRRRDVLTRSNPT
jgi:hypothetical protein